MCITYQLYFYKCPFFSVPIQVRVSPSQQTISVGQATHFNCTVSGFPLYGVTWTKNLHPVVTNERVRLIGTDVLSISSVVRDDKGIYQCFAHNNFDSAQASGALLLGGQKLKYFIFSYNIFLFL